jgi:phage terminase large subunit-like protein
MGQRGPGAKPIRRWVGSKKPGRKPKATLDAGLSLHRVERNIQWIEKLPITSGLLAGTFFKARPFQREIIENIYRVNDEGVREVRQVVISMPRKNGKTGLTAVLALLHLCGPEAVARGQVYSAASERKQAALIYDEMKAIIERVPELHRRIIVRDFTKQLEDAETGSVYFALSAEAASKHGFSPSCWIYDELAQAPDRKLYDVLSSATGAHAEPLGIVISTQSDDPQHIMSELVDYGLQVKRGEVYDPSFYAAIYAAADDADPWDEEVWKECNPALGDFLSMEQMRINAAQAQRIPARERSFRLLHLNQRVADHAGMISRVEWMQCQADVTLKPKEEIFLGIDLSGVNDLSALVACSAADGERLKAWFWKPGNVVDEHEARDRAPYRQWVKEEWIEAPKGKAIDFAFIAKRVAEICSEYKVLGLAYDRWRIKDFIRELHAIGLDCYDEAKDKPRIGALRMVPWGQGFADMAPAVDAFELSVLNNRLKHDGNPVLAMCVANAQVTMDAAGNRKLDKSAARFRIDGAVAAAMAIGLKSKQVAKPEKKFQAFFV